MMDKKQKNALKTILRKFGLVEHHIKVTNINHSNEIVVAKSGEQPCFTWRTNSDQLKSKIHRYQGISFANKRLALECLDQMKRIVEDWEDEP